MDWKTTLKEYWAKTNKAAIVAFVVGLVVGILV